jgi:hypothetical protein
MVPQSLLAQEAQPYVPKYDVKKCAPKVLNKKPFSPPKGSQPRKGEKATGIRQSLPSRYLNREK